jgi:signal transduction histidine kinase
VSATGWRPTVADEGLPPVRRQLGIQARLTIAATTLVAAVLVVSAVGLTLALRHTLLSTLDDSARQRARDVATLVDTKTLPNTIPVTGGTVVIQVVDDRGRVRAATPGGDALVPLVPTAARARVAAGQVTSVPGARLGIADSLRVLGTSAGPPGDRVTVLVAVSSSEATRSVRTVGIVLLVAVPLLVIAFAGACWFLVGAALRPVAALRTGAGALTGTDSGERLPVPPTRDEVARLATTLNDLLDRLAAGGARQRAFVADAAHELRSPLASMRTQLEVARAHPEQADWDDTAEGVLLDVERLSRLVDDLLLLARLDDARQVRSRGPVDLCAVAASVAERAVSRVPVRVEAADGPVLALADEDAVVRVLANLLGNADRHAAGHIAIGVRRDGERAVVTVSDDGPGIPEADRARVFERFARLDESRSVDSGGTGLGLPIVRQLLLANDGTIRLEEAGPGLRAVVSLPAAEPAPLSPK